MNTRMYPINEIFYSLQGEGSEVGKPALFIRLAGCNRKCDFCDTNHEQPEFILPAEGVAKIVDESEIGHVILTGGEPFMFDLEHLITVIRKGCKLPVNVSVETNGDFKIPEHFPALVVAAPKNKDLNQWFEKHTMDPEKPRVMGKIHFVKLLVPYHSEESIRDFLSKNGKNFTSIYICSVNDPVKAEMADQSDAVNLSMKFAKMFPALDVRYGVQLHKLIGVQ